VLHCLASGISAFVAQPDAIYVYADLSGMHASESPLSTLPSLLMVTLYQPDIALYSEIDHTVALLELTCPLDSFQHLESSRNHKQSKEEYLQILSELDRLGVNSQYDIYY